MSEYRHHVAHPAVIFVEVPSAGSPKPVDARRPPRYPQQQRQPWRPATRPPSKADATVRLLRDIAANEMAVRQMLRPQPPAPR